MTRITGFVEATRRVGVLGVHSLDHFSLSVPDLDRARTFYETFGLEVRQQGQSLELYTSGHAHRWGTLTEGPRKQLHYLSFGAFEDDIPRFRERLKHFDVDRMQPPPGFESNGLWFRDLDGVPIEIRVAEKTSPNAKSTFTTASVGPNVRGAMGRGAAPATQPRRLAHLALYTKDVLRTVEFYSRILGLRLSDASEGAVAFMHGVHGSDHHLVAFGKSEGPGMHHCSWDVGAIQEVGLGAMQMARKGFVDGWGMGRHVLGAN